MKFLYTFDFSTISCYDGDGILGFLVDLKTMIINTRYVLCVFFLWFRHTQREPESSVVPNILRIAIGV